MGCNYPGNIRELENCIERAAFTAVNGNIKPKDISCQRGEMCLSNLMEKSMSTEQSKQHISPQPIDSFDDDSTEYFSEDLDERERVVQALEKAGWVQAKAARMLNMTVRQMNYRIKKFDITVKKI
ncbi:MAG: hypothetical protein C0602_11080 [Denitrovibrio sp.]|nr:MAG: hypothetical protein C0602_11080 [Denitrovibrio sp.]